MAVVHWRPVMKQASRAGDLSIDFTQKELYLSVADFNTVFKMSKVRCAEREGGGRWGGGRRGGDGPPQVSLPIRRAWLGLPLRVWLGNCWTASVFSPSVLLHQADFDKLPKWKRDAAKKAVGA